MAKNLIISILIVLSVGAGDVAGSSIAAGSKSPKPLADGFVIIGLDGRLVSGDDGKGWFFEFDSDLSGNIGKIRAGEKVGLLPSSTLEKIIADAAERSAAAYRLWARVTAYEGKNYIFPFYFLPISELKPQQSQNSQQAEIIINEPNDALTIPQEIIAKLETRKIVRMEQLKKGLELKTDAILADRTGFIVKGPGKQFIFTLDALGWNIQRFSIRLLPCGVLEQTQWRQYAEPEQLRFNVAGIVTQYKGQNYLLLQRATRMYSYGNFGR